MKGLFTRLRQAAQEDTATIWFDVVPAASIEFAEEFFGFALPKLLKRSYMEISNGGFGPGPVIGLPGGYESSWGDLIKTRTELERDEECEDGWLPIIDWGCAQFSIIDCDNDFQIVSLYEGDFHCEDYSFDTLLKRWLDGELPELRSGGFYRPKR
jgi:hypothetical protein